jgi:hypothetical protein
MYKALPTLPRIVTTTGAPVLIRPESLGEISTTTHDLLDPGTPISLKSRSRVELVGALAMNGDTTIDDVSGPQTVILLTKTLSKDVAPWVHPKAVKICA